MFDMSAKCIEKHFLTCPYFSIRVNRIFRPVVVRIRKDGIGNIDQMSIFG